jgi:hypothetical protein
MKKSRSVLIFRSCLVSPPFAHIHSEDQKRLLPQKKSGGKSHDTRPETTSFPKTTLFPQQRSQNMAIGIRKLHLSTSSNVTALKEALVQLKPPVFLSPGATTGVPPSQAASLDVVDVLLQIVPTHLEIETVRQFLSQDSTQQAVLAEGENLTKILMDFPFGNTTNGDESTQIRLELSVRRMVKTLSFKLRAAALIANVTSEFVAIERAFGALTQSLALKKLLAIVLSFGNFMNHSTFRGSAHGFNLEDLLTLRNVTSQNPQAHRTFLNYLVAYLKEKDPAVLQLWDELEPVVALPVEALLTLKHQGMNSPPPPPHSFPPEFGVHMFSISSHHTLFKNVAGDCKLKTLKKDFEM